MLSAEPDGLREKLIEGRVQGKSWKELGEEHGTGSPGATRSAFQRLTGSADFKTKGPGIRDVVNGLKEGQETVIKKAVATVKVGKPIPDPVKPKVSPGRRRAKARGEVHTSQIWKDFNVSQTQGLPTTIEKAKRTIDDVLDIPSIGVRSRVSVRPGKGSVNGDYHPFTKEIRISTSSNRFPGTKESTFHHEFGHYLDNHAFGLDIDHAINRFSGRGNYASSPAVSRLTDAAQTAMDNLRSALDRSNAMVQNRAKLRGARLQYVTAPHEQFARGFAQYIADKTARRAPHLHPSSVIKQDAIDQMTSVRLNAFSNYQWSDEDFEPISKAFDELFRALGWLRE